MNVRGFRLVRLNNALDYPAPMNLHRFAITALVALSVVGGIQGCTTPSYQQQRGAGAINAVSRDTRALTGVGNFGQVTPSIFRGAQPSNEGFRNLRGLGVHTIINLRSEYRNDSAVLSACGLQEFYVPLTAFRAPTEAQQSQFLALINDTTLRPIFVHCMRGIDRTGEMLALYRIRSENWTETDALREMRSYGYSESLIPTPAAFVRTLRR